MRLVVLIFSRGMQVSPYRMAALGSLRLLTVYVQPHGGRLTSIAWKAAVASVPFAKAVVCPIVLQRSVNPLTDPLVSGVPALPELLRKKSGRRVSPSR